jgi:hypothetical protein
MGISKSELLGNGRQMGILDVLRQAKKPAENQPEVIAEMHVEMMNGFTCSKCSQFYPRPPLAGTCSCGGELLFASSKGPARNVVTGRSG